MSKVQAVCNFKICFVPACFQSLEMKYIHPKYVLKGWFVYFRENNISGHRSLDGMSTTQASHD